MNTRKALTVLLFISSFVILSLSGYQCATETMTLDPSGDRGVEPLPPFDDTTPEASNDNVFPPEPDNDSDESCDTVRCKLKNAFSGASAKIIVSDTTLTDYRLGRRGNFEPDYVRIFVKMNGSTYQDQTVYQGSLSLAYFGTCTDGRHGICRSTMRTGYSISDARYNKWTTKKATRGNLLNGDAKFHAIFEDSYGAYILKLVHVRERDLSDGFVQYIGAGEIYYKMFRIGTAEDIHRADRRGDCFNGGTYISQAHHAPPKPAKRCWLTKLGPFSCRPLGDLLNSDPDRSINLEGNYKCFNHFGTFYQLDIEEAFNINL